MKEIFHPANERGEANHGWLKSFHSFSFANFYDPNKMGFGTLRVLNDDTIAAKMGFSAHPHNNMEIISIPLEGELHHKDNMGNEHSISPGEIQVMSAGTGVVHSEVNKSQKDLTKFLQIWVIPKVQNVTPRYDQKKIELPPNELKLILSPNESIEAVWIHQDAYFYMGEFSEEKVISYLMNSVENGVYVIVLEGELMVNDKTLKRRDAIGLWETESVELKTVPDSKILVMEVPMK